ncbi:hypothetical protein [Actinacidiphila glaucinigra]|uniref:hypothetical protein n=1 Tax=Actinacidiphila glaucinigra TaxID=235986 RepID=UPI001FEA387F|nr:hypothetical protein [Actinacidiphila glaucinigra]
MSPRGESYHDSWTAVLDIYSLPPDLLDYRGMRATDPSSPLRPEYADSCLSLWLVTVVRDVRASPVMLGDLTPAYRSSENANYYYLLFGEARRFDYASAYLRTECNVLRGLLHPAAPPDTGALSACDAGPDAGVGGHMPGCAVASSA